VAENTAKNYDEDVSKKSSIGLDPKVANLLAYLFSWLGGLIIWLMEKENRFVKWNALQALILGICDAIVWIVFWAILSPTTIFFIGPVFLIIGWILYVAIWVFRIIAIVKGFQGSTYRIPGISKLADKWFKM
jgi:uncharacterized membrane protein